MPVLEFALDATALYRVQVHLNTHQGPVSVMLNHDALGSLTTLEEQTSGKDFYLPDRSVLRVQIINGHPRAWRNGQQLTVAGSTEADPGQHTQPHGQMAGSVVVLLILNVALTIGLSIWFGAIVFLNLSAQQPFAPFLLCGLCALLALIGILAIFAWKRWGFYLAACASVATFVPVILFGTIDFSTFLPLVGVVLLYIALRSSNLWSKLV